MTMSTRISRKDGLDSLPGELHGIDKVFGRDLRSRGWVVDLARMAEADRADLPNRMDETPDPAVIWALRSRRR